MPSETQKSYFSISELVQSDTAKRNGYSEQFNPDAKVKANLQALIDRVLNPVRFRFNRSILVNCGYRCPRLNEAVGGSKTSYHLPGCAADIDTADSDNSTNKELWSVIISMIADKSLPPIAELIWEEGDETGPGWIHIAYSEGKQGKIKRKRNGKYTILTLDQAKALGS